MNIAKFLKTLFLKNTSGRLLLSNFCDFAYKCKSMAFEILDVGLIEFRGLCTFKVWVLFETEVFLYRIFCPRFVYHIKQ